MLLNKHTHFEFEAGTDEAGRGCLAGPVTAAAIILPENFQLPKLNDSKKLSEKIRFEIRPYIEESALAFHVAHIDHQEIDKINILNASIKAMHKAIDGLSIIPEYILVDGNRFKPYNDIPYSCMIKGDGRFMNIAAASILAKTYRDEFMDKLDEEFPMYDWKNNKGYPTLKHRDAIREHGVTKYHRLTFKLLPEQLKLHL
uniref:ribonuclease HII n=1 Tax=Flavobacterium sp. TaxID=239 RepID=UPI00404A3C70